MPKLHRIDREFLADAIAEIEAAAQADALRRTKNAVNAGDAVDTSPDKLRQSDGNARD